MKHSRPVFAAARAAAALALAAALAAPAAVRAHGGKEHAPRTDWSKAEETAFGRAADPKRATRTIRVDMADTMRFTPASITVKRGETVRFVVRNTGKAMHEMVIGTEAELREHAELMKKFPDMEHDEPHMVHVEPGRSGTIGWQFTRAGRFMYGCLLPGHFEAGMVGTIEVKE